MALPNNKLTIIADTPTCADSVAVLKNTLGTTISTTSIVSGDTSDITAPDSTITINSASFSPYPSGATSNILVKDGTGTQVGSKVGSEWIVPTGGSSPSNVLFKFPHCSRYTSYRDGDEGWRFQNGWYDYTPPTYPKTIAELDNSIGANFFYKLKNPLIVNGVSSNTRFVDVNGVQVFTSTNNANLVLIDKLTGLMYTRTDLDGTNTTWNNAIDGALSHSIVVNSITYDDWYLMANPECIATFGSFAEVTGFWTDPINSTTIATYASAFHFTATTLSDETTYANSFRIMATSSGLYYDIKTASRRRIFVRKCQDLITSP